MTIVHFRRRPRIAAAAILALALLTGVLALRSHAADAATPIVQNANGQTATFHQFIAESADGCIGTDISISVTSAHSVATTASPTNQTVLNAYIGEGDFCTYDYLREVYWQNVPLTPKQFQMDNALNKAVLSGTFAATAGDVCNPYACNDDPPGTGAFNLTWQRVGDQLVSPSHSATHTQGQDLVNVVFSGQGYDAQANGSIVISGSDGENLALTSTNNTDNNQGSAYLSSNMSVNMVIVRPPQPITIPAGHTLTIGSVHLGCFDALTFGYQLDMGANVTVGTGRCSTPADTTIGPFAQDTQIRIWVTDRSASYCDNYPSDYTYYSDGLHALVTGINPYQIDIMDSGVGCSVPADQLRLPPGPGQGNLSLTLTISP